MPTRIPYVITFVFLFVAGSLLFAPAQAQGLQGLGVEEDEEEASGSPFIHGVKIGFGINTYQGDLSRNPNNNVLKYATSANPSAMVGVDWRFGEFEQYGLNTTLQYNRVAGKTTGQNVPLEFTNNLLALDFTADYDLPYIQQGLFRVFLGGGPLFVIEPTYENFPTDDDRFDELGSRVTGSFVAGVSMFDTFRIGVRVPTSGMIDGHTGIDGVKRPDYVGFIDITYRFDLLR
ncbi:MAG: hypothetical protein PPP56_10060 [Longimonas sp.]|uniref:hypothetical protein n=1 Tax=Longimonas sp. TaxID=2039626 RepID=UPI00334B0728